MSIDPPDFELLYNLTQRIGELLTQKRLLDDKIKTLFAEVVKEAVRNTSLWPNGKQPSMAYIETVYYNGLNGELKEHREQYARICGELEKSERLFDTLKMQLQAYQTYSADRRQGLL